VSAGVTMTNSSSPFMPQTICRFRPGTARDFLARVESGSGSRDGRGNLDGLRIDHRGRGMRGGTQGAADLAPELVADEVEDAGRAPPAEEPILPHETRDNPQQTLLPTSRFKNGYAHGSGITGDIDRTVTVHIAADAGSHAPAAGSRGGRHRAGGTRQGDRRRCRSPEARSGTPAIRRTCPRRTTGRSTRRRPRPPAPP
jgi:hypothetical protein